MPRGNFAPKGHLRPFKNAFAAILKELSTDSSALAWFLGSKINFSTFWSHFHWNFWIFRGNFRGISLLSVKNHKIFHIQGHATRFFPQFLTSRHFFCRFLHIKKRKMRKKSFHTLLLYTHCDIARCSDFFFHSLLLKRRSLEFFLNIFFCCFLCYEKNSGKKFFFRCLRVFLGFFCFSRCSRLCRVFGTRGRQIGGKFFFCCFFLICVVGKKIYTAQFHRLSLRFFLIDFFPLFLGKFSEKFFFFSDLIFFLCCVLGKRRNEKKNGKLF